MILRSNVQFRFPVWCVVEELELEEIVVGVEWFVETESLAI